MKPILLIVSILSYFYPIYGINGGSVGHLLNHEYVVSIRVTDIKNLQEGCKYYAGGIIRDKLILTVAKAFGKPIIVYTDEGERYVETYKYVEVLANTSNALTPSQDFIKGIGTYVYFFKESETSYLDVVVLKLDVSLENMQQLRLFKGKSIKTFNNRKCVIAAFGSGYNNTGVLKRIRCKTSNENKCGNTNKYYFANAVNRNGDYPVSPTGICDGDIGAPVILDDYTFTIIGVAFLPAENCDSRDNMEQYIKITPYSKFIEHVISSDTSHEDYLIAKLI